MPQQVFHFAMVEVFACDFDDFDLQVLRFFVFSDPFFFAAHLAISRELMTFVFLPSSPNS